MKPIADQLGTFMFNAGKVISDCLRPLCKNEYSINDVQKLPSMLTSISLLQDKKKDV